MSVTYDNASALVTGDAITSLTTPSFTITSSANRAAVLCLGHRGLLSTGFSGSCGGISASLITGTDSSGGSTRSQLFGVIAPASGSQTASMSWTTAVSATLGAITASGVDQTTAFNNGATGSGTTSASVAVTSTSGDLTTTGYLNNKTTQLTSDKTRKYTGAGSDTSSGGDIGAGTGTATHAWSGGAGGSSMHASGANFVAAAAAGRTTKNTRSAPLGMEIGMDWRSDL